MGNVLGAGVLPDVSTVFRVKWFKAFASNYNHFGLIAD